MLIIGLTGGIATGKTLVSDTWAQRGVPVIDGDKTYHGLLATDPSLTTAILEAFGRQVIDDQGRVDRRALGALVFADRESLDRLDQITHPAVHADFERAIQVLARQGNPVVVLSVPLLFEAGTDQMVDRVVVVTCSPEAQLSRLMARAGIDAVTARARIQSQMPLALKEARAWRVLRNDGSQEATREAAGVMIDEILLQAQTHHESRRPNSDS